MKPIQLLDPSEIQWLEVNQKEAIRDSLIDMFNQAIERLSINDENQENATKIEVLEMFMNTMDDIEINVLTGEGFSKNKLI